MRSAPPTVSLPSKTVAEIRPLSAYLRDYIVPLVDDPFNSEALRHLGSSCSKAGTLASVAHQAIHFPSEPREISMWDQDAIKTVPNNVRCAAWRVGADDSTA